MPNVLSILHRGLRDIAYRHPRIADGAMGVLAPLLVPFGSHLLLYWIARHRRGWDIWPAVAAVQVMTIVTFWRAIGGWGDLVFGLVLDEVSLALPFLLGVRAGARHDRMVGLVERADSLEREREQQVQVAAARERTRISREMHDIVSHNLAVMVALADGAASTASTAPDRATDIMQQVSATGREALTEMRRALGLLRRGPVDDGPGLGPQPGFTDLESLIARVREAGIEVTMTQRGAPVGGGPGAGLAVYRILQEALTNTMKHAGAGASVDIQLSYRAGGVDIEVTDDGGGTPVGGGRRPACATVSAVGGGCGLVGLAERAAAFGGQLRAGPTVGGGWRLTTRLQFSPTLIA